MAERATGFVFEIEVDTKTGEAKLRNFQGVAQDVSTKTQQAAGGMTGAFTSFKAGLLPIVGALTAVAGAAATVYGVFRTGIALLREGTKASAEQESADRRLADALASVGVRSQAAFNALRDQAGELQRSIGVADDAAERYMALSIQMSGTTREAGRFVEVAQDIATVTGRDVDRIIRGLGAAAAGTGGDLKALGIDLDVDQVKALGLSKTLDVLQGKFGGAARAEMQTFQGSVRLVGLAWGEVLETLGDYIARSPAIREAILGVSRALFGLSTDLKTGKDVAKPLVLSLLDVAIVGAKVGAIFEIAGRKTAEYWNIIRPAARLLSPLIGFVQDLDAAINVLSRTDLKDKGLGELAQVMGPVIKSLEETRRAVAATSGQLLDVDVTGGRGGRGGAGGPGADKKKLGFDLDDILGARDRLKELETAYVAVQKAQAKGLLTSEQYQKALDAIGKAGGELAKLGAKASFAAPDASLIVPPPGMIENGRQELEALQRRFADLQQAQAEGKISGAQYTAQLQEITRAAAELGRIGLRADFLPKLQSPIGFGVDEVVGARVELEALNRAYAKLITSYSGGQITQEQLSAGMEELTKKGQDLAALGLRPVWLEIDSVKASADELSPRLDQIATLPFWTVVGQSVGVFQQIREELGYIAQAADAAGTSFGTMGTAIISSEAGFDALRSASGVFANAIAKAAVSGKGSAKEIRKALGEAIEGVGREQAARAIVMLAMGAAASTPWGMAALGPAPPYFKAAGAHGIAAAAAFAAARILGGGGGGGASASAGGGGGGGGASAGSGPGGEQQPQLRGSVTGRGPEGNAFSGFQEAGTGSRAPTGPPPNTEQRPISVQVSVTNHYAVQAWDGESTDRWFRQNGERIQRQAWDPEVVRRQLQQPNNRRSAAEAVALESAGR